jgi:cold shock protein
MSELLTKLKKPRRSKKIAPAEPLLAEAEPVSAQPLGTEPVLAEAEPVSTEPLLAEAGPVSTQLPSERVSGTVKWFNRSRGYGFIEPTDGPDVFVHYSAIQGEGHRRNLTGGQRVEFSLRPGDKGPEAAEVVAVIGEQEPV